MTYLVELVGKSVGIFEISLKSICIDKLSEFMDKLLIYWSFDGFPFDL